MLHLKSIRDNKKPENLAVAADLLACQALVRFK